MAVSLKQLNIIVIFRIKCSLVVLKFDPLAN